MPAVLRQQQQRRLSTATSRPSLHVFNSLTNEVESFLPDHVSSGVADVDSSGSRVAGHHPIRWYNCGPTVYDSAHLGHARTYVCLDIIRRVLTQHFRLDVLYALGLTDVDDKIIRRAGEGSKPVAPLALARKFEAEFFDDLKRLGVDLPDVVLRVSEHIPDIVEYIEDLQAKGFAYVNEANNSVYFDVAAFNGTTGNQYGTMGPAAAALNTEEAGQLLSEANADEGDEGGLDRKLKRDPRDFVLWKAAKPDLEPRTVQWNSPWGLGRPGWHIECSVMSRAACGDHLDLHSGGIDLKFPHHCNEVAQSEAFNGPPANSEGTASVSHSAQHAICACPTHNGASAQSKWSRFFLHTGHLYIEGLKMSKSLKNFISVRDLLSGGFSPDSFRMFCLQYSYRSSVHYSPDRMEEANALLRRFDNFLRMTALHVDQAKTSSASKAVEAERLSEAVGKPLDVTTKRWREQEVQLRDSLSACRHEVDHALADDFNTPRALQALLTLTQLSNNYVQQWEKVVQAQANQSTEANATLVGARFMPVELISAVRSYVADTFKLFGFQSLSLDDTTVLRDSEDGCEENQSLQVLLEFRAAVRALAVEQQQSSPSVGGVDPRQLFQLCDSLRDDVLPRIASSSQTTADLASAQVGGWL